MDDVVLGTGGELVRAAVAHYHSDFDNLPREVLEPLATLVAGGACANYAGAVTDEEFTHVIVWALAAAYLHGGGGK